MYLRSKTGKRKKNVLMSFNFSSIKNSNFYFLLLKILKIRKNLKSGKKNLNEFWLKNLEITEYWKN